MAVPVKVTIGIVAILLTAALIVSFAGARRTSEAAVTNVPVHGIVADTAGKPIAGAMVTARLEKGMMSRFTDANGRFTFPELAAGEYELAATAYGYNTDSYKAPISLNEGAALVLNERWDANRLSTAEWLTTTTHKQSLLLELECMSCHTLHPPAASRGLTAAQWEHLIKNMGTRANTPRISPERMPYITAVLEEMFGPNSPVPSRDKVRHVELNPKVAKATFMEWKIPTESFSHSLVVAGNKAVFSERDFLSNALGVFDFTTQTFKEIPYPMPKAGPHTPVVARDGKVYMMMTSTDHLGQYDPATGEMKMIPITKGSGGTIPTLAPDGSIWWGNGRFNALVRFDPKTQEVDTSNDIAYPEHVPAAAWINVRKRTGDPDPQERVGVYGIAADSEGKLWVAGHQTGTIGSLNPKTHEWKHYPITEDPGESPNPRGVAVGADDTVWFSTYAFHKLGKFDQKTQKMTLYQPPTEHSSVYGIVVSKKTGQVWFADPVGSHITRFDPKTEEFVEYPLPTLDGYARFIDEAGDGRICFTEWMASKIGCLTPGDITPAPTQTH